MWGHDNEVRVAATLRQMILMAFRSTRFGSLLLILTFPATKAIPNTQKAMSSDSEKGWSAKRRKTLEEADSISVP
jgi:hypothetical protein